MRRLIVVSNLDLAYQFQDQSLTQKHSGSTHMALRRVGSRHPWLVLRLVALVHLSEVATVLVRPNGKVRQPKSLLCAAASAGCFPS
jgi:hypothetical protein